MRGILYNFSHISLSSLDADACAAFLNQWLRHTGILFEQPYVCNEKVNASVVRFAMHFLRQLIFSNNDGLRI